MHTNFYFLQTFSRALGKVLTDTVVSECFSQHKDELILRFEGTHGSVYLKADVQPDFSCLSVPETFHRARKNSVNLFDSIVGQRVISIRQYSNERSFALLLTGEQMVLFKMHGNRSNIILIEHGNVTSLFKSQLKNDWQIKPDLLDRTIDWSYENFLAHQHDLKKIYFTFGKVVWRYLDETAFHGLALEKKWKAIQHLRHQLEHPVFYIILLDGLPHLSLLSFGTVSARYEEAIEAVNAFFQVYTHTSALMHEKATALATLRDRLSSGESYYKKTSQKLSELQKDSHYKMWGDMIMANLHIIKPGVEQVTLNDFSENQTPTPIKLKKELTPQKNAESYYRKSKNQQIEIEHLKNNLAAKQTDIEQIKSSIQRIEQANDLKKLRQEVDTYIKPLRKENDQPLPYHEFDYHGFKIWVGKNAANNDVLTLKYGYKEDLWLHAKDVAGAHVIVKYQAGKNFPKDVIERAAELAAYNSKRKNESLCPVTVTPRKFVRKRKGDPAGMMVVEREDVILVEPKL